MCNFLCRLDPKAVKKLDGGMLLRLQDLRKEVIKSNKHVYIF